MERRLAAILSVDVVGYSRLMEEDEAATYERLRRCRIELFEPEIAAHRGRIFKVMGDGLLAEFASVVDAMECATLLQRGMAERNDETADRPIHVRMGVHVGDVIVEDDDCHGDAVNIAARLQQLAVPGGICVSGAVVGHVRHKVALQFKPRGTERLKNIAEPISLFDVALRSGSTLPPPSSRRWMLPAGTAVVIALCAAALTWHRWGAALPPAQTATPSAVPQASPSTPAVSIVAGSSAHRAVDQGLPVLVVLPFADLTGQRPAQTGLDLRDLGRGIAEEFTTDLATFPDYEVVSSTSAFAYAEKSTPEIVKATGALFVIEGSIRETSDKLLVTMQLINGLSDRHLTIDNFDEPLADPVSLQAAVVNRLRDDMGGMTGGLREEYNRIALAKHPIDRSEYDYYALGHIYHLRFTVPSVTCARRIWEQGLEQFPDSALLRYKLSFTHGFMESAGIEKDGFKMQQQLVEDAGKRKRKSRLDDWYALIAGAFADLDNGRADRAVSEIKASVDMAPYDSLNQANAADILIAAGLYGEALPFSRFALANDPNPKGWYFSDFMEASDRAHKWPDAVELAEQVIRRSPSPNPDWLQVLAKGYAATGQADKSKDASDKALTLPKAVEIEPPACDSVLND